MAIAPKDEYPAQIDTSDPNYPYGKAQNIALLGDGTGTPWEKKLVSDILGFQQALLVAAGITPSGTPDNAVISQYLDALKYIATHTEFADGARILSALSLQQFPELDNGSGFIPVARIQPIVPLEIGAGTQTLGNGWRCDPIAPGSAGNPWYQHTQDAQMVVPLTRLIDSSELVSVRLIVRGDTGPGGPTVALPSVSPKAQLWARDLNNGGSLSLTASVNDPAGSVAQFNAAHFIDMVPVAPVPISPNVPKELFVSITGSGTGFEADKFAIIGCIAQFHAFSLLPG